MTVAFLIDAISAINAIERSFATWNGVKNPPLGLTVIPNDGANGPDDDGIHTVGWVRTVPRNVLAATWVWATGGTVTDVDIFLTCSINGKF